MNYFFRNFRRMKSGWITMRSNNEFVIQQSCQFACFKILYEIQLVNKMLVQCRQLEAALYAGNCQFIDQNWLFPLA